MSKEVRKIICYDSTVLSNFAYTDSTDVLLEIADDHKTASQVIQELKKGYDDGYDFLENILEYLPTTKNLSVSSESHPIHAGTVNFDMYSGRIVEKMEGYDNEIKNEYAKLLDMRDEILDELDQGEAHALYYLQNEIIRSKERNGEFPFPERTDHYIFATDDRDAREFAQKYNFRVTGSVGILAQSVKQDVINSQTANKWLSTWVEENGYYSPINDIKEVVDEL